jgi:tRNA 5-methylaminomethyl-2-thiouridine biosynthesis bifunctional protein
VSNHSQSNIQTATIEWRNGTPYCTDFGDYYYHSGEPFEENGLKETQYLFLEQNNLKSRWQDLPNNNKTQNKQFVIGETGFGTGLNFLAACDLWLQTAPSDWRLQFITTELRPIRKTDLQSIHQRWPCFSELSQQLLDQYPEFTPGVHSLSLAQGRIQLLLMLGEANQMFNHIAESADPCLANYQKKSVDAWFLDGFAPTKNPDIWCDNIFLTLASLSSKKTSFATFTSASQVRKGLANVGFEVEKIDGFGRKRESLKGQFVEFKHSGNINSTHWHLNNNPNNRTNRQVLIIGAGIAGCTTAKALAERGFEVTVVDRHPSVAGEGSGNLQAVVYPKLSRQNDILPRINLSSMIRASHYYKTFWDNGLGAQCGVLLLPESPEDKSNFEQIAQRYRDQDGLVIPVDNPQMGSLSGLELHAESGLFFPQLGWLPPRLICQKILDDGDIPLIRANVTALNHCPETNLWTLQTESGQTVLSAETVVIANAFACREFSQTKFLSVNQLRGQVTHLPCNAKTEQLKTVICGKSYIAPADNNLLSCGATYNKNLFSTELRVEDHQANLNAIGDSDQAIKDALGSADIEKLEGRANYRCTSKDYLPIVGPVPNVEIFKQEFQAMYHRSTAKIDKFGSYLPNLFVHCGLGSRGLSYAPLTSELLAAQINGEIPPLERDLRLAMHPARFLIRDLKRRKI